MKHTELPSLDELESSGMKSHEIAFQIWGLWANQSAKRTSDILKEEYGLDHSPSVVSSWAHRHQWRWKLKELLTGIAPSQMEAAGLNLVGGVPDAAWLLAETVRGNVEPNRDRINAATAILDRVGFLPHTRREATKTGLNQVNASAELPELTMSDAELEAALSGIDRIRAVVQRD